MELFDKVNEIARSAVSKTGEVLEDTRLKTQILNDEKSIRELQAKIGAFYYKNLPPARQWKKKWQNSVLPSLSIWQTSTRKRLP